MSTNQRLRRLVDSVIDAVVVLATLIGVVLAAGGTMTGCWLVLAAIVLLLAQLAWTRFDGAVGWTPLGRAQVLRSAAVLATASCLYRVDIGQSQAFGVAFGAAALIGSIAVEPLIARSVRFRAPLAIGLAGLPIRRVLPDLGLVAIATSAAATVAGLLIAAFDGPVWLWVVLALVAVVPAVVMAIDGRLKIIFARRLRAEIPKAVAAYAPDFVVYTSRPDDASYQVMMWLPYLQRAGLRFMVVTRGAVPAEALAALTDAPVVEARGIRDVDGIVVPSVKAAFYVNASSGNGALVRFQHLTHIYLGHGDSDKPPSYNPTHAMYDRIFAAGPAATRRYAAHGVSIPAEKFVVVGRPQVEAVEQVEGPIANVGTPTVLYAPTWRGHVEETLLYSLPVGVKIVTALLERGATVIFRPHPFSYDFGEDAASIAAIQTLLAADARRTGRPHLWGAPAETDRGILDCINASDAMVSDVSSVVSDYLFSGKPFAMVAVPSEPAAFVEEFPVATASYVIRGDLADLEPQLDLLLGPDPLAARRTAIRVDYLGDFPAANYASAFVDAVRDVCVVTGRDDDAEGEDAGDAERTDDEGVDGSRGRVWSRYGDVVSRVGLDLGATVVALVGFGTALLDGPLGLTAVLSLIAAWAAFQSVPENVLQRQRWSRLLTEGDVTRTVLVFTWVVVALARASGGSVILAPAVLLVTIALERRVRAAWGGGLLVRNLPAALRRIGELVPRGLLPLISTAVTLSGFALLLIGGPLVIMAVAAVLVGAVALEMVGRALWRAAEVERAEDRLRPALEAYAPQFAVYFASTVGASYQIGMWLPYFVRIGRPFVIITRTAPMLNQIELLCGEHGVEAPLIYRPTLRSVEEVIVPSMTTSFYVNNAARNTHFVERRELTHVWLNHGDSEKPACFNPVHAIYDQIFAAGQAGIDRYARHGVSIPPEKFLIVGRPQVEQITPARGTISAITDQTVLYAPTWQGPFVDSRVYSLPMGEAIVRQLLGRGARVIFRAHPFNYRYPEARQMIDDIGAVLDADRAATGREHLWGPAAEEELSIEDCFNASDAMVSDVSAVVSDYLHSGKPFAMCSVGREPEQLVVEAPAALAAYVLREDLSNLDQVCDDLLDRDPLQSVRDQTKRYYLGDFPDDGYAEGFLTAARQVIDAGSAEAASTARSARG